MSLINVEKDVLNRTTRNSVNLIDKEKNECWKLQKFKWAKSQIVIAFCFDNWQATNLLKKIITNIYNSFVFIEIFTSFWNHFVFFCRFIIHHSIYILWLDNDHSTAKHLDSFHPNSNFSKHSLYISSKTSSQSRAILHSCLYQSKQNAFFFSKRKKR